MPAPAKPKLPKRTSRNRPRPFTEGLSVPFPIIQATEAQLDELREAAMARELIVSSTTPHWSWLRVSAIAAWVLACIALGLGVRLLLQGARISPTPEVPTPIAQTKVVVVPQVSPPYSVHQLIGASSNAPLNIRPAEAIIQAVAGTPLSTLGMFQYQAASQSVTLQPGFRPLGSTQGNTGVPAVIY